MRRLLFILITLASASSLMFSTQAHALTSKDLADILNGYPNFDPEGGTCTTNAPISGGVSITTQDFNPDPAAMEIYNTNYKSKIEALIPLYQKAAQAEGLADWQLLPAIHTLETSVSKTNPTGNDSYGGVFQMNENTLRGAGLFNETTYQSGKQLTDEEFVAQAQAAIRVFIKPSAKQLGVDISKSLSIDAMAKLSIAYKSGANSPWLTGGADPNLHAYTWAGFDITAAHKLPMFYGPGAAEKATDEQTSKSRNVPGTATTFTILKGGFTGTGIASCNGQNASVRSKIVSVAQEELGRWTTTELVPGSGYLKYSGNIKTDWCAYFASWVYAQAGVSLTTDNSGRVAAVEEIKQLGIKAGRFHERGDNATYTPQPGDIVVRQNDESHVNIVVAVNGDKIDVIGGNQGGDGKQGDYFETSRVSEYTTSLTDKGITGYVSPE